MSLGVEVPDDGAVMRGAARLLLLHDAEGKVLVLLPAQQLLNLSKVWSKLGRQVRSARPEDASRFFGQSGLQQASGRQRLMESLPLLVDSSLQGDLSVWEMHSGLKFDWALPAAQQTIQVDQLGVDVEQICQRASGESDVVRINRAVERFTELRMQQRLEDTLGLPALAPTTQKIILLRSDPDAGVDDLVPVVRVDPSLSAQVMSWAVSPYYAAPGKVSSIDEAIIRVLGFDLVVNLALGIAMGQVLAVPEDMPRGSTPYWKQAVHMATLAEMLARKMPLDLRPKIGLVYLSGLLHNFGYLVLAHLFPPQFSILSRYIEANPHLEQRVVELQVLNVTRDQIGGWLLESWNLPEEVCEGIRQQQLDAPQGEGAVYAQLLKLSATLLRQEGLADGPVYPLNPAVSEALGLQDEHLQQALAQLREAEGDLDELTHTLSKHRAHALA